MLNENYRKFIGGFMSGLTELTNLVPYTSYGDTPPNFVIAAWNNVRGPSDTSANCMSVIVGSGDTKPTSKDTQLSNIIDDLTYVTSSMSHGTADYVKIISITYKNNTSEVITVKELGLTVTSSLHTGWVYIYQKALLGRIVLDTPVVMSPGDTYTFTYCIE